jgi:TRAP-type C4-dicarboxylate transport system substrate-binding protein
LQNKFRYVKFLGGEHMKRYVSVVAGILTAAFTATAVLAQDYPRINLRFGHYAPPTAGHSKVDSWFADELSKRSGGQITQDIVWSGAIGQASELLDLAGQGAVDISAVSASYFPAELPLLAAPSALPLTLKSRQHAQDVMLKLWHDVPEMRAEAEAKNVLPLMFHALNTYHLLCTRPVRSLEDLKGLKIRSQGEYIPLALNAIGAVPVTVLPGEFYESLQRNNVDCMLLPWDLMTTFKLEEVAKYGSTINFGALISGPQWYNLDRYNGFPQEVRDLLDEIVVEAYVFDIENLIEAEQAAVATMKAAGVEIIEFPDQERFEQALPDFLDLWQEKMTAAGKADVVSAWRSVE